MLRVSGLACAVKMCLPRTRMSCAATAAYVEVVEVVVRCVM